MQLSTSALSMERMVLLSHPQVVRMWEVSPDVLHSTAALGGSGLTPFYELLEGGKDGVLAKEMEEYFYYSQMRSQSVATTEERKVGLL